MTSKVSIAILALAFGSLPLSAQIVVRNPTTGRVVTRNGEVVRAHDRIPPGQLPPRGQCRVWIDGVPPGLQPPVTDCVTAERNRVANSRVIYGDRSSFPGKGKGKVNREARRDSTFTCTFRDAVVVDGRVVDVCRDANGNVIRRDGKVRRDRDDDDDKFEKRDKSEKEKGKKGKKDKDHDKHDDHDDDDRG